MFSLNYYNGEFRGDYTFIIFHAEYLYRMRTFAVEMGILNRSVVITWRRG